MSILAGSETRVLVQGITGREGSFHTRQMIDYGTRVVGGVTPGKGGSAAEGVPVFDTVAGAVQETGADASVIFVPRQYAADSILEALGAGLRLCVCITEGIPVQDMIRVVHAVGTGGSGMRLVGPNCPGLISVDECKMGIMPGDIARPGPIGVISRSGTLTYEVVDGLTRAGLGQSTCVGIGGDPILGSTFADLLPLFEADESTEAVVLIGEIGGNDEEVAAEYVARMTKPVIGFISGRTAPPGKRMGHAGAIVTGGLGTAQAKVDALTRAGVPVAESTSQIPDLVRAELRK